MSRFSYVGIDIRGKTSSGEIVANDIKEARLKIKILYKRKTFFF